MVEPSSSIVPFQFEANEVRAVERDGEPWFVLVDVCRILGIGNASDAAARLDADEKDALDIVDPMGRAQRPTIINESGLYSMIMTSRKEEAKRFKRWVTSEVLPAIRKTGRYAIDRPKTPGEMLLENAKVFRDLEIRQIEQAKQLGQHGEILQALGAHEDYRSIKAHAAIIGRKITLKESGELGRLATALSNQGGYKTGRQVDETFGKVNTYHRDVLAKVFE